MTVVSISSLDIFFPAIAYHGASRQFLLEHGTRILTNAQPLSEELHKSMPQQADEFDRVMQTLAQRFTDEAELCRQAVDNLVSHFDFLATAEAGYSHTTPQTLPDIPLPDVAAWLSIEHTPLNGVFDELERKLREYAGDLEAFEQRVQTFEHIVWIAINQPDQLKFHVQVPTAGWEPDWLKAGIQDVANVGTGIADDAETAILRPAINFIQAHQSDIYGMIDNMRKGFNTIFIPRTDPDVLQGHIDYLQGIKNAYDRHIQASLIEATQPVATQYHPPAGQDSYQKTWPTIAPQQQQTSMALANAIGQLQHIQGLNEFIAIDTTAIVIGVGVFAVALLASAAIVTLVGTIPAMIGSGGEVIISVGGVTINVTAIATTIIGFFSATFLGAAVWEWTALVVLGAAAIATWEFSHQQVVDQSTTSSTPQSTTLAQSQAPNLPGAVGTGTCVKGGRYYVPPKKGRGQAVWDKAGKGFIDAWGNIWQWAQDPHGGPHWDVQHPDGSHTNVAPDGTVIGKDNFPNSGNKQP